MAFVTTVHNDYNWPYPKPIVGKPCEPPIPNSEPTVPPPPVAPYCHCDVHSYEPRVEQYKQLLDKEQKLCDDYSKLRKQMINVTNDILDNPCDDLDTKMSTIYQLSFKKKSYPVSNYRKIMAAANSAVPIAVDSHKLGVLRCYKDPTNFGDKPPTSRPTIHPPPAVHTGVTPESIIAWNAGYPGRTEYMDCYSATANACWRSMQRYKEPLPSSRRRADNSCS